jgi:hypothetical protein
MDAKSAIKKLVTIICIFFVAPQVYATFPGSNGVISYSHVNGPYSYGSEYHTIRAVNQDGTGEHDILDKYYVFTWAGTWSADGKKYLYERGDLSPKEIWQANADGSSQKKITTATCTVANPSWSPDGEQIIFQDCKDVEGYPEIYTVNIDGTNRKRLTNNRIWEGEAQWSPDGKTIVYTRDTGIWLMNSDGTNARKITNEGVAPDWSPDGKKIAYRSGGVSIVDTDGSNKILINVDDGCGGPIWSPDGKKIAFAGDKGYGGLYCGIYVMDIDGSNQSLVTSTSRVDDRIGGWQPTSTNAAPIISAFTATPKFGNPPLPVSFVVTAKDSDGKIASYNWDFNGDGKIDQATTTGKLTHIYNELGTFNATVNVVDNGGAKAQSSAISISIAYGPDLVGTVETYTFNKSTNTIHIDFKVTNQGDIPVNGFSITFNASNDGTTSAFKFNEAQVEKLAVGESKSFSVDQTFRNPIYGRWVLILVDPNKEVAEINEKNNGSRIIVQGVVTN